MKETSKAKAIGELVCGCGRVAYVEQTKRRGNFLQLRCGHDHCGVDTRTGKAIQALWRDTMKPLGYYQDSKTVTPFGADTVETVADTKTDTITDSIEPIPEPTPAPTAKPAITRRETIKPKQKYSNLSPWVGLALLLARLQ